MALTGINPLGYVVDTAVFCTRATFGIDVDKLIAVGSVTVKLNVPVLDCGY